MYKKWFIKIFPFGICIITGSVIFICSNITENLISDLLLNIAAAFFVIPILYVLYDITRKASERHLSKELHEYLKMQIDTELLTILSQLIKSIYSYDIVGVHEKRINDFLRCSQVDIKQQISTNTYIGFQVLKDWSVSISNTKRILENPFTVRNLENDQSINIIRILKSLSSLEVILKQNPEIYDFTDQSSDKYRITKSSNFNNSTIYPDRYLLLMHIKDDNFIVKDFGDFSLHQEKHLLNVCTIKKEYIDWYSDIVDSLRLEIRKWFTDSGGEILFNPIIFKRIPSSSFSNVSIENQSPKK